MKLTTSIQYNNPSTNLAVTGGCALNRGAMDKIRKNWRGFLDTNQSRVIQEVVSEQYWLWRRNILTLMKKYGIIVRQKKELANE